MIAMEAYQKRDVSKCQSVEWMLAVVNNWVDVSPVIFNSKLQPHCDVLKEAKQAPKRSYFS